MDPWKLCPSHVPQGDRHLCVFGGIEPTGEQKAPHQHARTASAAAAVGFGGRDWPMGLTV